MLEEARAVPTIAVTDLERAKEFYGRTLGLEELHSPMLGETDTAYRVGDDSYLYVYERPTPSGSTATACAFAVQDVDGVVRELRRRGVRFEEYHLPELGIDTVDGIAMVGGVRTAWFKDPSGNILALESSLEIFR